MAADQPEIPKETVELYNKGVELAESKSFELALLYFELATSRSPLLVDAWVNRGSAHYQLRAYEQAYHCFKMALSLPQAGDNGDLLSNMGAALFKLKKYDEALTYFNKALASPRRANSPTWKSFIMNWTAWVLTHQGKHEAALKQVESAIEQDPKNTNAIDTKGLILYNLGKDEEALEIFNKAIGADSGNKYAWYNKGNVQVKLANYDDAMRCYDKALELDKNFAEAHNGRGIVSYYKKNYEDATAAFRKAIELKPDLSSAHENLAKAVAGKSTKKSFLEFWSASKARQAIAISLTVFALGFVLFYPVMASYLPMYAGNSTQIEIVTNSSGTTTTTTSTTSSQMPQYYLVVVGLAILILLMPEVKTLKIGPFEFEKLPDPEPAQQLPIKP